MKKWSTLMAGCALAGSLFSGMAHADDSKVLYFYNWSEYIPDSVLTEFTKETGIKVIYSTYESNESMYAKLKTMGNNSGYDLVVPSSYFVSKMAKEGMLEKLDHSKLPHFKDIDPMYLNKKFDPNNQYSVPYIWGATGIGVNTELTDPSKIHSWADLWDPKWKGQLMMMDDAREFFAMGLRVLGYSGNTTNVQQIQAAYKKLQQLMPNVLVFNSDFPANPYISGDTPAGMLWNGSAYMAQQDGAPVTVVWPKEGPILWMDNLAIPAGAKHKDAAYKMINFLLRPDNAAKIALKIGYPTPVATAKKYLPKSFVDNPLIYPPKAVMEKGEWQSAVGDKTEMYEELFQKLKANSES